MPVHTLQWGCCHSVTTSQGLLVMQHHPQNQKCVNVFMHKKWAKYRYVVLEICMWTDTHLHWHTHSSQYSALLLRWSNYQNKKHLKNVAPIRYCEPFYIVIHSFTRGRYCRHCRTPPAHRCPRRRRRRRRQWQRQRVTEGTAMAQWNGPNYVKFQRCKWRPMFRTTPIGR